MPEREPARRRLGPRSRHNRRNLLLGVAALVGVAGLLGYALSRGLSEPEPVDIGPTSGLIGQGLGPDQPGDALGLGRAIHVAAGARPGGNGSAEAPLGTIQAALDLAAPGDAIRVGPGTYPEPLRTVRAGTEQKPIWLVGDRARIVPPPTNWDPAPAAGPEDESGRLVLIGHDHIVLYGFDISGANKNVWVFKASYVRILRNTIHDGQGECVRIKYFSSHNEIAYNQVANCGLNGFNVDARHKNGEAIYIGTAPEQRERKNPTSEEDQSNENWVHDNDITPRAECTDVKEGARGNVIERNTCQRSQDPDGGGFSSRGIGTSFLNNISRDNAGAGIRLGGDSDSDGVGSVVRGNQLLNNQGYGVKVQTKPQSLVCGNVVDGNAGGPSNSEDVNPSAPCPPEQQPSAPAP